MILIKKFPAPSDLETLKKEAEEQGHLCAYCMRRIPDVRILEEDVDLSDVYIEHWQARSAVCDTDAVTLPKNRKAVLDMIQEDLANQEGDFQQNCIEQLHIWENETDPKTPYIGIAIWWLKKQIHLLNAD